jgi:molybdopterin-biosynthesis enzyme MoeA-like protein
MSDRLVTVCVVIIGNEILSGRTQDTNIAFLGERLNALGVRLMEARVIPAKTICEPQCTA